MWNADFGYFAMLNPAQDERRDHYRGNSSAGDAPDHMAIMPA
jgi:hypothetical protein